MKRLFVLGSDSRRRHWVDEDICNTIIKHATRNSTFFENEER